MSDRAGGVDERKAGNHEMECGRKGTHSNFTIHVTRAAKRNSNQYKTLMMFPGRKLQRLD